VNIRYEVTIDDLVAFTFYHSGRSPAGRRAWIGGLVWQTLAAAGLFLVVAALVGKEAALGILILAAVSICFILAFLWKLGFRPNTERFARQLCESGLPRGAVGPHELELTERGLEDRTPYSALRTPLGDLQGVASDGERTFIYIGPAMAHVIPHRAVSGRDLAAFVEAVRMRVSENAAEPTATSDPARDHVFPEG
jgi:hypothetical protein